MNFDSDQAGYVRQEERSRLAKAGQLFGKSLILDQKCTADVVASDNVEVCLLALQFLIENNEPFRKTIEGSPLNAERDSKKSMTAAQIVPKYGFFGLPPPVYF